MIVLSLPYPVSANRYWASRVVKVKGKPMPMVYVTADAKAYRAEVAEICAAHGIRAPLAGRLAMRLHLYPHRPLDWRNRQRKLGALWDDTVQCIDLGNAEKVLADALQGIVYEDDKHIRRLNLERMEPDEHGARVVVTIEQIHVEQRQGDLLARAA